MILDLNHKKLNVYQVARDMIRECYKINSMIQDVERHNLKHQITRASESVILNMSEGASRSSPTERRRYFEISRGSIIEIDTALQVALDLNYITEKQIETIAPLMRQCFAMLCKMMDSLNTPKNQ